MYCDQKPRVWSKPEDTGNGVIRVTFADVTLALNPVEADWLATNIQREIRRVEYLEGRKQAVPLTDEQRQRLQIGDRVLVRGDDGTEADYVVKAAPWQLGHGAWVVGLAGISGGYLLERVVGKLPLTGIVNIVGAVAGR